MGPEPIPLVWEAVHMRLAFRLLSISSVLVVVVFAVFLLMLMFVAARAPVDPITFPPGAAALLPGT
jgi:hypothetical protein